MSAIGSIGSSAAAFVSRVNRSQGGRPPGGPDPIQQKLTQLLESQGVGSQEQSEIKDELETALETAFYSDSSPPTLSSLKETFDAVLEKHGIDSDQITAALRPPVRGGEGGPPPGGPEGLGGPGGPPPPSGGNGSVEEEDETESLLEILEKAAERARKQAAQNDEASVATRAQFSSSQFRSNQYNSTATSLLSASSTLAVEA